MIKHTWKFLILILIFISPCYSQEVIKNFSNQEIDSVYLANLKAKFGNHKKLLPQYESQMLLALSYFPELTDTKIIFKSKKINSPLMMRPTLFSSIFRSAKKRKYIIFVSSYSSHMDQVIVDKLNLNAQVGVIGHELCHVSFFIKKSRLGLIRLIFGHLSSNYIDRLEYDNDK
jgi:hypothetical protein